MEQQGLLKSWSDDKGFGFIQPQHGGAQVFAHISAMRGDRRPVSGDRVLYIASQDGQGRLRAEHVRVAGGLALDQPAIRVKPRSAPSPADGANPNKAPRKRASSGPTQYLGLKITLFAGLCSLPLLGSVQLLGWGFMWPLLTYAAVSSISFMQYWQDKRSALRGRWRTPENAMHLVELLGGWPGALLAQQCFRHKTRKVTYQLLFWVIVVVHQVFWFDWLLLDGANLGDVWRAFLPR